ncbi:MAG: hypothetical protein ACRDUY_09680 [Nitriliruptorales bacterium]
MTKGRSTMTAFDALDPAERGAVLAELLAERPDLRGDIERLAAAHLRTTSVDAVAGDIEWELESIELEDLAGRAGRQPGRGYVHENEAAYELVEQAVQPFVDDMLRRARLGMTEAAAEVALGIIVGLYGCREAPDGTVLAYAGPDTPRELAGWVASEVRKAGVTLAPDAIEDTCPDWAPLRY